MVVDLRRVVAADEGAGEQMGEQLRAGLGELVQRQDAAGEGGEGGEQPGASGGFQHQLAWRDRGRVGGAERCLQCGAQDGGIEGLAPLQRGQQQPGGVEDGGRPIGGSGRGRGCEHGRPLGQRGNDEGHGGIPESLVPKPAGALSTRPGSPRPGHPLALRAPRARAVSHAGALVQARALLHMTNEMVRRASWAL